MLLSYKKTTCTYGGNSWQQGPSGCTAIGRNLFVVLSSSGARSSKAAAGGKVCFHWWSRRRSDSTHIACTVVDLGNSYKTTKGTCHSTIVRDTSPPPVNSLTKDALSVSKLNTHSYSFSLWQNYKRALISPSHFNQTLIVKYGSSYKKYLSTFYRLSIANTA